MCSLIFKLMKKDPPRPNSLSHFKAHEKEVHWTQNRSFISKLVKKDPTGSEKEVRPDPNSLSHFKAREKEVHPDLFFNLRLRKASKPLRERV